MITVLPRRVVPQPLPEVHPGGDCGACVLGGLMGLDVAEVYRRYGEHDEDGAPRAFSYLTMERALWKAEQEGRLDRLITDVPLWPDRSARLLPWGLPGWCQNLAWFRYVRMAIDAGYYGIANVVHAKSGPLGVPDHWVLLVGARVRTERRTTDAGTDYWTSEHEVLVSCSSTTTSDEEWVVERDFLRERGGFNLLLARPVGGA